MSALSKKTADQVRQIQLVLDLVANNSMPKDDWYDFVDNIELRYADYEQIEFKMEHTIINGMYIRRIYMPKGSFVVSGIHKTFHPFAILKGRVLVRTHLGNIFYRAPYRGITEPGTRRVLFAMEDVIWETFHPTNLNSVTEIMNSILDDRRNPLLSDEQILKLNSNLQKMNLLK